MKGTDSGVELEQAGGSVWIGRGGGPSAMAIHLWDVPGENEVSETIKI